MKNLWSKLTSLQKIGFIVTIIQIFSIIVSGYYFVQQYTEKHCQRILIPNTGQSLPILVKDFGDYKIAVYNDLGKISPNSNQFYVLPIKNFEDSEFNSAYICSKKLIKMYIIEAFNDRIEISIN